MLLKLFNVVVPIAYLEANYYNSDRVCRQEKDERDAEIGLLLLEVLSENSFWQSDEYDDLDKQANPNDE